MNIIKVTIIILFLLNSLTVSSQFNLQRSWGTYFGDERFELKDSKVDSDGNLYIVGSIYGTDITELYPFTNSTSFQQIYGGGNYDGFIVKFNAQGNIVWGTYFGGSSDDQIYAVDLDNSGNVYIIGSTFSNANIATIGSFQENIAGSGDAFISKFTSSGTLVWSTYFGGTDLDNGNKISFDGYNHIYISGSDFGSTNIATPGVFREVKGNASSIIAKFDLNGNRIWATYYGERGIFDMKAHSNSVYVTGTTLDCPPNGSYNTYYGTANGFNPLPSNCREIYLSKFDTDGQRDWSTYYGGNQSEGTDKNGIGLKDDKIYLAGTSPNYSNQEVATTNTYQPNSNSPSNFIAQFNQDGTRNWGTYNGNFGNPSNVFSYSHIEIDAVSNTFYNYGSTGMDENISTADGYLPTMNSQYSSDAFICKFTDQNTKSWGTYYGGELGEKDIGFHPYDNGNRFYIVGNTQSLTQIATPTSLQPVKQVYDLTNHLYQSAYTIFIAHFEPLPLSNSTFNENLFSIYPNPNNGNFTILLNSVNKSNNSLELFDLLGKKVISQKLNSPETNIQTNNLSKGVYIAKITNTEGGSFITKIVVE